MAASGMITGFQTRLVLVLVFLLLSACSSGENEEDSAEEQQQPPPRPAQVMEMSPRDIELNKSYSAMLRSDKAVDLVARVTGFLQERHFEPGAQVQQGELLYTIEPDVYEAAVGQRQADLQSAQAEEARARRDAERFTRLLRQNSVSERERDEAMAQLRVAEAAVAQAEAALRSARIDLGYTEINAPVSGVVSLSNVNVGNLVSPGTELASITPLDPLEVRFQLPQEDAFELRRQRRREDADITARLEFPSGAAGAQQTLEGRLDFLGSRVSERTSTVQASATFSNSEGLFLPGQFVRVNLEGMKRYDVLAVPEIAVTQGLMGPQVFVLDAENTARTRNVTVGETAGPWEIISDGLKPGDRVIVGDPGGIQAGMSIEPQRFDGNAERLAKQEAKQKQQEKEQAAELDAAVSEGAPGGASGGQSSGQRGKQSGAQEDGGE